MYNLPISIRTEMEAVFEKRIVSVSSIRGGMINNTVRLDFDALTVFVKWNQQAPAGFFTAEADGLGRLRDAGAIRVPKVLHLSEGARVPAFLVLEYIHSEQPDDAAHFARRFGQELAEQHRVSEGSQIEFGLDQDNYIGLVPQINTPAANWPDFYRDCRLLPQIALARQNGRLTSEREALLQSVVERLEILFDGFDSRPSLLHGDLWAGNYLVSNNRPVLCDPAVYFGDREMEIAYMELFGGIPSEILRSYREHYPLQSGYEKRRPLHQLYPLLNHLNHFGESYGSNVDAACHACLKNK